MSGGDWYGFDREVRGEARAQAYQSNNRQVLERNVTMVFEETLPLADGLHTYISIKFPLHDADGAAYGVCGIATDITDRKQTAEVARQQEDRLQRTARLITMGEMASTLAHELNQPLAAIANYCAGSVTRLQSGKGRTEDVLAAMQKASSLRW